MKAGLIRNEVLFPPPKVVTTTEPLRLAHFSIGEQKLVTNFKFIKLQMFHYTYMILAFMILIGGLLLAVLLFVFENVVSK